ncbi:MAG: hypothetical protein LBB19_02555 [Puniceicoccales bacterium]|nr:hypothetical protein [Puniceicoccales bacterium]
MHKKLLLRFTPIQFYCKTIVMSMIAPKLNWCIVRLGNDCNWWVKEISDPIHWDLEGLSILDPKQVIYILDLMDTLKDYGLDTDILDRAFFKFRIDKRLRENLVRLTRVEENLIDSDEPLFALPNSIDEEKGPYADLIDHVTRLRVRLLNDSIDFKQNIQPDEIVDDLNEQYQQEFFEGSAIHCYRELSDILEYIPAGFELDREEIHENNDKDDIYKELEVNVGEEANDKEEILEQDETMHWEGDDENNAIVSNTKRKT